MTSFVARSHLPEVQSHKMCVLGAGSFGTAMAVICARNGHDTVIYARDAAQVEAINTTHTNPRALQDFELPQTVTATTDFAAAVENAAVIIHALPAQKTPDFLKAHAAAIPAGTPVCITSKGLYLPTKQLLGDAIVEEMGRSQCLAYLSGPSFAKEILQNQPTAVVVACEDLAVAEQIQRLMSSLFFRVYTTDDVVGVQLGGALKNPLAIGAGMIEGRGLGINTMAAYVTKAQLELQLLCQKMGGRADTISGLAGVGDLMLTAFGSLSRNRTTGVRLASGEALEDILKDMTVEGVPTASVAQHYADKFGLEVPLFRAVAAILDGTLPLDQAHVALMGRPLRSEAEVR